MPIIKEVTLYTFDELNESAKEKARDWWRGLEMQDFEPDCEDFIRMGAFLGIEFNFRPVKLYGGGTRKEPEIYWSGFWNQGDGACFVGSYAYKKGAAKAIRAETNGQEQELIRIAEHLQRLQRKAFYGLCAKVTRGHLSNHYSHSGTMAIEVYNNHNPYAAVPDDWEDGVSEALRDFADWMYHQLEEDYNWRQADEQVDDSIRANEYTFTADGQRED